MSLTAKERILKLREAEYRLQKLQNDLMNGEKSTAASVSEFFAHHKELMALPGSNKDSVPFRFSFEASKRYAEVHKDQHLTLPPKMNLVSTNRLKQFKEPIDGSEKMVIHNSTGIARHPSLALQTFLNELDEQTSKMAVAFPKLDKSLLLNKTIFGKSIQPLNSRRYVRVATASMKSQRSKSPTVPKKKSNILKRGASSDPASPSTSFLFLRENLEAALKPNTVAIGQNSKKGSRLSRADSKTSIKSKTNQYDPSDVSKIASATASVLLATHTIAASASRLSPKTASSHKMVGSRPKEDEKSKNDMAYALGTTNLMGVILPQKGTKKRRGYLWDPVLSILPSDEAENMTAKDALTILRKRKLPQRKSTLPLCLPPHERGLIGVEISEFEPQYGVFYRDRSGNYNPHLYHSKTVRENMQKMQMQSNRKAYF